jgi:hypothetical protein
LFSSFKKLENKKKKKMGKKCWPLGSLLLLLLEAPLYSPPSLLAISPPLSSDSEKIEKTHEVDCKKN